MCGYCSAFGLHQMHEMLTVVVDNTVAWCVCLSQACVLQKAAERIEVLFGVEALGGPMNLVLVGVLIPLWGGGEGNVSCCTLCFPMYLCSISFAKWCHNRCDHH